MNLSKWIMSGLVVVSTSAVALPAFAAEGNEGGHAPKAPTKKHGHHKSEALSEKCDTAFDKASKPLKKAFDLVKKEIDKGCAKEDKKALANAFCSVVSKDGKLNTWGKKAIGDTKKILTEHGVKPYNGTLKVGPRFIVFGKRMSGTIQAPFDRTFISPGPVVADAITVQIFKGAHEAKAPEKAPEKAPKKGKEASKHSKTPTVVVKVCAFASLSDKDHCTCKTDTFDADDTKKVFKLHGVAGKFLQVLLDGKGGGKFPYTLIVGHKKAQAADANSEATQKAAEAEDDKVETQGPAALPEATADEQVPATSDGAPAATDGAAPAPAAPAPAEPATAPAEAPAAPAPAPAPAATPGQ